MPSRGAVQIAAVGKLREPHWAAAQKIYLERLRRYTTLSLTEVKDWVGRGVPDAQAAQKEGQELLDATAASHARIVLTPEGKLYDTPALARFLEKQIEQSGKLSFLIGGPVGFSQDVQSAATHRLSLSPLTFPHELARVMLLEQLYRAFTVLAGEKYHK